MASRKLLLATQGDEQEHKGDLSSMIDMVFLLLIFFMVSANFIKIKMDPRVKVPEAEQAYDKGQYKGRIVLNIFGDEVADETGARHADEDFNELQSLADVTEYVRIALQEIPGDIEPQLHVRADATVEMRHTQEAVKAALDGSSDSRLKKVIFASKR